MDLVEEFLELGESVTVTNLVELLRVLRRRIPGRYLPKNLKDLVGIDETDTKNVGRHFWSWLNKQKWRKMLPRPFPVEVVLKDERREVPNYLGTWHLHLPSDLIHSMYTYDIDLFRDRWLGPPGALEQFWNAQRETEWFKMHPILSNPDVDLRTHFPILCHGDDADSHRRRSFCVCTIASPLSTSRSSWDTRFPLYIVDNTRALNETFDCLDAWIVHGLCELQEGSFMDVDVYGRPWARGKHGRICGPYTGVFVALKGDQKFLQKCLKLTTSATSELVCMYCKAKNHGDLIYTAFGPSAPHRECLVSNVDFLLEGCRPNSWIRLPGFHLSRVLTDWLHLIDLSLIPEVSASALIELTEDDSIWPGDHQDERLRMAFVQFTSECRRHGVRNRGQIFSVKQMYPLGKGNYPTLVQKHFNGAEATVLAKWLKGVTLAAAAANPASEHCALRASIFVNLVAMRSAVGKGRNDWCVLKPQNLSLLQRANFLLHSALNSLATEAIDKEVLLWKIRPKIHQIDHLCIDQAAVMNPLTLSTYDDEDFIGKVKGLAMRSDVRAMGYQTLHRYAAYACCRWLRQITGS